VEDTSLDIEGEDIGVNIRWLIEEIKNFEGKKAKWKVILGVNDGLTISLYQGFINGRIVNKPFDAPSFGFDPYFIPDGSDYTLHELEKMGLKDQYSARKIAVQQMLNKEFMMKEEIKNIPKWNGDYQ
jgi:inosine/xanthosine triphosphate pyrophosphatase family protein